METGLILVDDHELLRTGLRARLRREENIEVLADVGTAAEAYSAIEQKKPQLVLMDLDLPDESGLTATAKIKSRWPAMRVLALTGSKPSSVAKAVIQAGADGLVTKNESSDELIRAIHVVMSNKVFLSPDAATALATDIKSPAEPAIGSKFKDLTERERAVLKSLAEGLTYKEIAADLGVSVKSVETYRSRMTKKLGCTTRAELVRHAVKLGLVRN